MMQAELQATCSALGYQEGHVYHKEPDCLETVKDLIRFLKREDETCDIRRQLGHAQILVNDLIPILKQYSGERILLETVIRLMVNLTQPAVLCFQNHIPEDKGGRNHYLDIEAHLQAYKEAFADEALFAVLTKKLGDLLQLDWERRQEEDRLLIERLLVLIRNILHVPPNSTKEQRTDDDVSIHDQVLWALHTSGMEDLLLYLASSEDEQQFALHVLEIISLMFREQTPEQLSKTGRAKTDKERWTEERELAILRDQERERKKNMALKLSSRHSRFGGTFEVANMKSISAKNMIYHRSLIKVKDMNLDYNKVAKRKPKNRQPIKETPMTRRSTLAIRLFLKEFCVQFLENCYNPLMAAVKDALVRARAQENDETYYLWAMRFFMEFSRMHNFRVDIIGETISIQTFHYIQTQMATFHEMMLTNKKEAVIWGRRLHLALKAYYELLHTLNAMDRASDEAVRESAKVLRGNVFYMMEYRDIFIILLKKFDETKQSRVFLKDLIEATHLYTKMLESYSKQHGHLVVQKKKRKKAKRRTQQRTNPAGAEEQPGLTEQQLEDLWDNVSSDLSAIFQGRGSIPDDVSPFDAASEVDVDQQRVDAMIRIQDCLRESKAGEAVALFRAAREVWPDRDEFGSQDISPEEEFMALREVFYANLPRPAPPPQEPEEYEEEEADHEVEQEEMEGMQEFGEVEFSFKDFIMRFVHPSIVRPYCLLLAEYKKNTPYTNHCVAKMLHRVAFDCRVAGMLFQAALFRTFQKILQDPLAGSSSYQELVTFAKYVLRKFFETAQKNPKVFVEVFFWKSVKESVEMTEGEGAYQERQAEGKGKVLWSEEEEMELQRLCEQYKNETPSGTDLVDYILANIIDQNKTRRQVLKKVKLLELATPEELRPKPASSRAPRQWREEEELQLRTLVDEFRDTQDPIGNILAGLTEKRSRQKVVEKALEMGLIQDKKELYKKRAKSGRKKKNDTENFWGEENPDEPLPSEPDSEPEEEEASSSEAESSEADESSDDEAPSFARKIKKAASKARQQGLKEEVKWIQTCLRRIADDRDEEGGEPEPVPIVPLSEQQEEAMENQKFLHLLRKAGLKQPGEQERFWRVPATLNSADIRLRADMLDEHPDLQHSQAASGKRQRLEQLAKQRHQQQKEGKKRTKRHVQKEKDLDKSAKKKKLKKMMLQASSDEEGDVSLSGLEGGGPVDDDDDDIGPASPGSVNSKQSEAIRAGKKKQRAALQSSDEDEDGDDSALASQSQLNLPARDGSGVGKKKSCLLDSDDEGSISSRATSRSSRSRASSHQRPAPSGYQSDSSRKSASQASVVSSSSSSSKSSSASHQSSASGIPSASQETVQSRSSRSSESSGSSRRSQNQTLTQSTMSTSPSRSQILSQQSTNSSPQVQTQSQANTTGTQATGVMADSSDEDEDMPLGTFSESQNNPVADVNSAIYDESTDDDDEPPGTQEQRVQSRKNEADAGKTKVTKRKQKPTVKGNKKTKKPAVAESSDSEDDMLLQKKPTLAAEIHSSDSGDDLPLSIKANTNKTIVETKGKKPAKQEKVVKRKQRTVDTSDSDSDLPLKEKISSEDISEATKASAKKKIVKTKSTDHVKEKKNVKKKQKTVDSSDSDSDLPLKDKNSNVTTEVGSKASDSDDDLPLKMDSKKSVPSSSDSDDDMPLVMKANKENAKSGSLASKKRPLGDERGSTMTKKKRKLASDDYITASPADSDSEDDLVQRRGSRRLAIDSDSD